jgi:hypothetical protein
MYKTISLLMILAISASLSINAQTDVPKVNISGYMDCYIASDNDGYINGQSIYPSLRKLTYINSKKDQFSLNTAQVNIDGSWSNFRGAVSFHYGDLHRTAYPSSGNSMPAIQQANVGFKIIDNLWFDAGYFLTHIGGESLLPKDNWLTSHSIVTYFEPFYQAGIRASYESDKFTGQLYVLNGNGIFEENNDNKTLGVFLSYKPIDNLTASYASVFGNEEAGSPASFKMHMLNCFVVSYSITDAFALKGQFDLATKDVTSYSEIDSTTVFSTIAGKFSGWSLTAHYQATEAFSGTLRYASANNSDGVYAPILKGNGITAGVEYKPSGNSYIRLEGTYLTFDDTFKMFLGSDNKLSNSRMEVALNFGVILK